MVYAIVNSCAEKNDEHSFDYDCNGNCGSVVLPFLWGNDQCNVCCSLRRIDSRNNILVHGVIGLEKNDGWRNNQGYY